MTLPQLALDVPSLGPEPQPLPVHGRWVIGSDPERADLVLEDPDVDGMHCVLLLHKDGGVELQDLGSGRGTQVNGTPVTRGPLQVGDRIEIGALSLWLVDEAANAPSEPAQLPKVPGYQLHHPLGRGEGGTVYLATQESLQRKVALKVLSPELAHDPDVVRRFEAEARAAAALGHNHVVTVYDVGSAGDTHYLSMEFMDGGSWADRLQASGPLPWRQVVRILSETCAALEFAEAQGLVHRDIKPANLMTTSDGVTKLADLGLVLDLSRQAHDGPLVGTPHFMAPELIRGAAPSPASDLYALGASAYQLLSGRTPFQGTQTKEILRAVVTEEAPSLHSLDPDLPVSLSDLIARLMAKEPADRPMSARALGAELDALAQRFPTEAVAAAQNRRGLWVGVGLLLVVGVGSWAVWGPSNENDDPREESSTQAPQPSTTNPASDQDPATVDAPTLEFVTDQEPDPMRTETPEIAASFEQEALDALRSLQEQDLTDSERITRLRALAQSYRGSRVADEALATAGAIEEAQRSDAQATAERQAQLRAERQRLAQETRWDAENESLLAAVERTLAFVPTMDAADLATFESERARVLKSHWQAALRAVETARQAAQERAEEGDFSGAFEALHAIEQTWSPVAIYPLPEAHQKPDVQAAQALLRTELEGVVGDRLALPARYEAWADSVQAADRRAFGSLFGRASGLRQDVEAMAWDRAIVRIDQGLAILQTPAARGWAEALRRDLEAAQRAHRAVITGFEAGQWKRAHTLDPRASRPTNVDVTAIGPDWISLDGERLPWTGFFLDRRCLLSLLDDRLRKDESAAERADRAALFRMHAAVQFLMHVQEMFTLGQEAKFTEGEAEATLAEFAAPPEPPDAASRAALDRERRAAAPIVHSLRALSEDQPGAAAGYLERAIDLGRETWVVTLLSDGSGLPFRMPTWTPPEIEAPPSPEDGSDAEEASQNASGPDTGEPVISGGSGQVSDPEDPPR